MTDHNSVVNNSSSGGFAYPQLRTGGNNDFDGLCRLDSDALSGGFQRTKQKFHLIFGGRAKTDHEALCRCQRSIVGMAVSMLDDLSGNFEPLEAIEYMGWPISRTPSLSDKKPSNTGLGPTIVLKLAGIDLSLRIHKHQPLVTITDIDPIDNMWRACQASCVMAASTMVEVDGLHTAGVT